MSTQSIRQALRLMQEIQGHSTALTQAAALTEVEAIERAAAIMQHAEPPLWDMTHEQQREAEKAQELLAAIARQESP